MEFRSCSLFLSRLHRVLGAGDVSARKAGARVRHAGGGDASARA